MAVVVECVGVAGVGKSHMTRLLVDALNQRGVFAVEAMGPLKPQQPKLHRIARKLGYSLAEIVRSPRAAASMVSAVLRSRQRDRGYRVALVLNWLALRHLVRRAARAGGVHVFDQGALTALWSTGLHGEPRACRDSLRSTGWSWVLPDVVVRVTAPTEQTLHQLRGRGAAQSRVELLGDGELRSTLDVAEVALQDIVQWWQVDGRAPVHLVVNPGDARLRDRAEELAVELEATLRADRAAPGKEAVRCVVG
jgi:hypothetical protein